MDAAVARLRRPAGPPCDGARSADREALRYRAYDRYYWWFDRSVTRWMGDPEFVAKLRLERVPRPPLFAVTQAANRCGAAPGRELLEWLAEDMWLSAVFVEECWRCLDRDRMLDDAWKDEARKRLLVELAGIRDTPADLADLVDPSAIRSLLGHPIARNNDVEPKRGVKI